MLKMLSFFCCLFFFSFSSFFLISPSPGQMATFHSCHPPSCLSFPPICLSHRAPSTACLCPSLYSAILGHSLLLSTPGSPNLNKVQCPWKTSFSFCKHIFKQHPMLWDWLTSFISSCLQSCVGPLASPSLLQPAIVIGQLAGFMLLTPEQHGTPHRPSPRPLSSGVSWYLWGLTIQVPPLPLGLLLTFLSPPLHDWDLIHISYSSPFMSAVFTATIDFKTFLSPQSCSISSPSSLLPNTPDHVITHLHLPLNCL